MLWPDFEGRYTGKRPCKMHAVNNCSQNLSQLSPPVSHECLQRFNRPKGEGEQEEYAFSLLASLMLPIWPCTMVTSKRLWKSLCLNIDSWLRRWGNSCLLTLLTSWGGDHLRRIWVTPGSPAKSWRQWPRSVMVYGSLERTATCSVQHCRLGCSKGLKRKKVIWCNVLIAKDLVSGLIGLCL